MRKPYESSVFEEGGKWWVVYNDINNRPCKKDFSSRLAAEEFVTGPLQKLATNCQHRTATAAVLLVILGSLILLIAVFWIHKCYEIYKKNEELKKPLINRRY